VKEESGLTFSPRVRCVYIHTQPHGEGRDRNGQLGHQTIVTAMKPQPKVGTVSRGRALWCGCQSKQPNGPVVGSLRITSVSGGPSLAKHYKGAATKEAI
jgi:hypothetical protein